MITISQERKRDGGVHRQEQQKVSPLEAALRLTQVDLIWGGAIESVDVHSIQVATTIFGAVDTSRYEGPAAEMNVVHELIRLYQMQPRAAAEKLLPCADPRSEDFTKLEKLLTQYQCRAKAGMLYAAGIDRSDIVQCLTRSTQDLVAAVELWKEDPTAPFIELLT